MYYKYRKLNIYFNKKKKKNLYPRPKRLWLMSNVFKRKRRINTNIPVFGFTSMVDHRTRNITHETKMQPPNP